MKLDVGQLEFGKTYGIPVPETPGGTITPETPQPGGATITIEEPEGDDFPNVSVTGNSRASIQITGIQWTYDGIPISTVLEPSPDQWFGPRRWPPNDVIIWFLFDFDDEYVQAGQMRLDVEQLEYGMLYGVPVPEISGGVVTPETPQFGDARVTFYAPDGDEYPHLSVEGSTQASIQITGIQWTYDGVPIGPVLEPEPGHWYGERRWLPNEARITFTFDFFIFHLTGTLVIGGADFVFGEPIGIPSLALAGEIVVPVPIDLAGAIIVLGEPSDDGYPTARLVENPSGLFQLTQIQWMVDGEPFGPVIQLEVTD
jgi:hypothetical protein